MKHRPDLKALFRDRETRCAVLLALVGILLRVWYFYDFSGAPTYGCVVGAAVTASAENASFDNQLRPSLPFLTIGCVFSR